MNNALLIGAIFSLYALIGVVGLELELTTYAITPPEAPEQPGSGLSGIIDGLIGIAKYVFNATFSIFQIMSFQADIPAVVSTLIALPMLIIVLYIGLKLIRG